MRLNRVGAGATAFGLMGLAAGGLTPQAQSFDCRKSSTQVERMVCRDRSLGDLDVALAAALKRAIANEPARRQELLADERAWILERDARCTTMPGGVTSESRCVADRYRAQIAHLEASEALAACNTVAARYRVLGEASLGKGPLYALTHPPTSGVTIVEPVSAPAHLAVWAASQTPPFLMGDDVLAEFERRTGFPSAWELARLPGTGLYSISALEGTAHCYDSLYFEVKGAEAHLAGTPPGFEDEGGGGCGVWRAFGRIDDRPAFFQELYDYTPRMSSTLTITTRQAEAFTPACTITFSFEPSFGDETLNPHEESCRGPDCDELRRAALQLTMAVQNDPAAVKAKQFAALSSDQNAQYNAAMEFGMPPRESEMSDPGELTDEYPLRFPYVVGGRMYVAGVGHFTIGWRYFSDWSVTFDAVQGGKLVPEAAFAVGMRKGALQSMTVKAAAAEDEPER